MESLAFAIPAAERVLDTLVRASLQGAILIAVVWAVCRLLPRLPAALRCALWWLACLQLLVALAWTRPVSLPILPAAGAPPAVLAPATVEPAPQTVAAPATPAPSRDFPWGVAVLGIWLAGLLIHLAVALAQLRETRRVARRAEPVAAGPVRQVFAEMVRVLGMRRSPDLRSSAEIPTPQALGLLRPLVLLPRQALERLSPGELAMTLCHEALHVRRGDLWLGWVPALAERLFFFHPLAALAAREYALAREAACDAGVLRVLGAAPQDYGRLLLRLGIAPRRAGLAPMAAAGASPSFLNLKRRLQMLEQSAANPRRPAGGWWLLPLLLLLAAVPYRIVAQDGARDSPARQVEVRGSGGDSYALRIGDSVSISGSTTDPGMKAALAGDGDLLWFRHGGKEYVVRDAATLERARKLFEPQEALGREQAELGKHQAALGRQQAELGRQQASLGREQAAMARQRARGDYDAAARKRQDELGARQDALGDQQSELGDQQEALGRQQEELGLRQEETSRQAEEACRGLTDEAVAKGVAKEVR